MNRYVYLIIGNLFCNLLLNACSYNINIAQWLSEIKKNTKADNLISVHDANIIKNSSPILMLKNIFADNGLVVVHNKLDDKKFSLTELKMVGYLLVSKQLYALLQTPYDILKLKLGDKIGRGKIILLTKNFVEIDNLQQQNNKNFHQLYRLYLESSNVLS